MYHLAQLDVTPVSKWAARRARRFQGRSGKRREVSRNKATECARLRCRWFARKFQKVCSIAQ